MGSVEYVDVFAGLYAALVRLGTPVLNSYMHFLFTSTTQPVLILLSPNEPEV